MKGKAMRLRIAAVNMISAALSVWAAAALGQMHFAASTHMLDRALKAVSVEWSRDAALETLKDIAEGKPKETIIEAASRAGMNDLGDYDYMFGNAYVRSYAMDRIGASDLPEAIEYLKSMTIAKVGPDSTETIYPASQVALYKALYRQETDRERQIAFLERQLTSAKSQKWRVGRSRSFATRAA
jgi:hypothetical protein